MMKSTMQMQNPHTMSHTASACRAEAMSYCADSAEHNSIAIILDTIATAMVSILLAVLVLSVLLVGVCQQVPAILVLVGGIAVILVQEKFPRMRMHGRW